MTTVAAVHAASAPGITGMWEYRFAESPAPPPPEVLTAFARQYIETQQRGEQAGHVRNVANMKCLPTGFPQLMLWRSPIEIMQGFGRVSIITEHDPGNDEPRTIYLNRAQQSMPDPSWNGHSVGKWVKGALVIDTVGLNGRGTFMFPVTTETHVVERLSLEQSGRVLADQMSFDDPKVFVHPYSFTVRYNRMSNSEERMEAVCEPDLEALKQVDLQQIKDYDAEAARMLDPDQQYNVGGTEADHKQSAAENQ